MNIKNIENFEKECGLIIPNQYKEFIEKYNGYSFDGGIVLYALEELLEMNESLQIQMYQHDYIAIGDDGGGLIFLMKQEINAKKVLVVDMSDYDVVSPFVTVENFELWFNNGCKLDIREVECHAIFNQVGDIFLVRMPQNGIKDLIKIKQVFCMNISSAQLLSLSKVLPCKLVVNIKYAKAIKLIEKIGQPNIFEFRSNDVQL